MSLVEASSQPAEVKAEDCPPRSSSSDGVVDEGYGSLRHGQTGGYEPHLMVFTQPRRKPQVAYSTEYAVLKPQMASDMVCSVPRTPEFSKLAYSTARADASIYYAVTEYISRSMQ